jgi:hypothetical protein
MHCKLFSEECAKKCGVAGYKYQLLLFSMVLSSSRILESVALCGGGYGLTAN